MLGEIEPDRTGLELSCSHHIGSIFVLVWQRQTYPRVHESDNEIPFQKRGRSAEQVVHIRSGAFQKAIRYRTYHFWNRSVPARNRHRNCAGPVGSNVNRRPIRYGFWGAKIIDPVQCEHGLRYHHFHLTVLWVDLPDNLILKETISIEN